jgi:signal transduction histidine kinase/DNA-binding response OmpR family regulator
MKEDVYYRILLVNSPKGDIASLRHVISSNSAASVDAALSQKEAMVLIDYHAYDLIFINIDKKDDSGIKLIDYIQASFLNSKVPIVLITDKEFDPSLISKEVNQDMLDFIPSPVLENELLRLLRLYFKIIKREQQFNIRLQEETHKKDSLEIELAKSQENFINIVDKSAAAILIVDQDGVIQFCNPAGEQIFMREKSRLIGHQFGNIFGFEKRTEMDIIRSNGEVGVGEVATINTEWKGKPAKLILINDITKHKRLQENLLEAMKRALDSDRLKTAFLANMSHEIRTPLNGVIGFSQLLDSNNLDQEQKHFYVKSIISCGNYLLDIINDIIDIAQIESDQLVINKSKFDLVPMVNEVYEIYKINAKVVTKNLEIALEYPKVNSMIIYSDPFRVKQVMLNLLNNAIKFTDSGKISFGFEWRGNNVQFYVKDTGRGIPEGEFENIFNRFQQLEAPKNRLNEGNGLGLSISRALVHLLDGTIWLESEVGSGTTFYFTLPAIHNDVGPVPNEQHSKVSKVKASFKNKKILVVEDEENNFYFIQAVIKDFDTMIYWAKNGEEAVDIAMKEDIDLILMDMKLPLKSGYDAVKEIRLKKPQIPIIAQTGYAMSSDKDKVMAAGCNDYIAKPINVNELMSKMNTFLN